MVILSDNIRARCPGPRIVIHSKAVLIGAVDKAFVFPAVAPGVSNNPSSHFVFIDLSNIAVPIEVELYTVVISADGKGVIERFTPRLHIFHAHHTCGFVGGRIGDSCPSSIRSHTDTCYTASVHGLVAAMVVEPFLEFLPPLGSVGGSKIEIVGRPVPHGAVPLVVALHPSVVGVIVRLRTKESAVGTSTVCGDIWDAITLGHSLCGAGLICQQPGKVRGILVLGQRSIGIAIAVYLVSELIAHTSCGATGTAILIEDGRKVLVLPIIDIGRQLHLSLACLATGHIFGGLRLWSYIVLEVRKDTAVNLHHLAIGQRIILYLCHTPQIWQQANH